MRTIDELAKNFPVEEIVFDLPESKLSCDKCGGTFKLIGKKLIRRELDIIPQSEKILGYYSYTYTCDKCEKDTGFAHIITTKTPPPLMPNEKWLTDVTKFKWYEGPNIHKLYLSAILDLYDRRIVAFITRDRNDNPLVFDTLDAAIKANPNAHPLFHSDRGFQYTNRAFYNKLKKAKMRQSMSRVAKCIDNGPMEGFGGILKRERYYSRRFTSREELVQMIEK